MKIMLSTIHPQEGKLVFAINNHEFVGVACFENGKWYSVPAKNELGDCEFYWIDLEGK